MPEMVGSVVGVYQGKTFNQVEIKPETDRSLPRGIFHHVQTCETRSPRYWSHPLLSFHSIEMSQNSFIRLRCSTRPVKITGSLYLGHSMFVGFMSKKKSKSEKC